MAEMYALPILVCRRCRYRWHPRTPLRPARCPRCNNTHWDAPYTQGPRYQMRTRNFWKDKAKAARKRA